MQLTILKSICLNLIQISTCNLNPLKLITTLKIMVTYRFVLFLHCFLESVGIVNLYKVHKRPLYGYPSFHIGHLSMDAKL